MKPSRRRFSNTEYQSRQLKTRYAMMKKGIDTLIVSDPSNINWLTGYDGWSFYVHQCVVISVNGDLFWFGRCIDANGARLTTDLNENDIVEYPDDYVQTTERHPMEYLASILRQRRLHEGSIGLEKDNYYFSALAAESLYASLVNAEFSDATALVNWQRAVKSQLELDYMRRAGHVVESIYDRIWQHAQPGMRKNDLVAEILHAGAKGSGDDYGDYAAIVPLIGSGDETAACHMTWDGSKVENNTGVFFELAGVYARYHCPCSRTLYLGDPPQKYRDIEKVINECTEIVLEKFKPGVTCGEIASTFYETLNRYGFEKDNRCGYSIGLSYPPDWGERTMSLRVSDKTELISGMCFHFMPAIWFADWGFEMTESIVVTDNGGEQLSQVPRKLFVK